MVAALLENMTEGVGTKVDLTELQEVGVRLSQPSNSKDPLCHALEQASLVLSTIQQLPPENVLASMNASMNALIKPALLKHKDKDVQFLVTACISEIMRIVAPDAPYDDDTLKEIFELIVTSFKGLNDKDSRFFDKRMRILDSVASVRSCVVMLDLECDDLIREMFQTFFTVVSEEPKSIILAMRAIMCLVLEESEEVPLPLLEVLLRNLLHDKKGVSSTGYALARAVFERCDAHLRPHIEIFLTSKTFKSKWRDSYHDLIFELSKLDPGYIVPLVPKLMEELQVDKVEVRLKAIRTVGRILASKGNFPENFNGLFMELLIFFSDNVFEVRLASIEFAKQYLLVKPSGPRAQELLGALNDRLEDPDAGVRRQVVVTICNFAKSNLDVVPIDSLKKVSECLLDKEVVLRQEAFQQLIEVHREFCLKVSEGLVTELESFCWIPSKLISCYGRHAAPFLRAQPAEVVFAEELFPAELSLEEKVECLIVCFANFDSIGLKVFEKIFDDKQRLQQEMKTFLANLSLLKDKESKKVIVLLQESSRRLAGFFADPEAELQFQRLSDTEPTEILLRLLDLKIFSSKSREDFLRLYEEKGFKLDFLRELAVKCSFALFDSQDMRTLLMKVKNLRNLGEERMLRASVGLMLVITKYFPGLIEGAETYLLELLKDDRDFIKDGVVKVLAKAPCATPMELLEEYNSVNLLEKLCVDGNKKQVKYAIQALSSLCGDAAPVLLTELYGKLLDAVKSGINLPTTLKALGIIAQHNIEGFKARQEELATFLIHNLLRRDSDSFGSDDQTSEATNLKAFGLKMFVKIVLAVKGVTHIKPPKEFFEALLAILKYGEVSEKVISSNIDKASLRLAAANSVVELSRVYDDQIPPQLFHAAISCAKDLNESVKYGFLKKVYQSLMEQAIPSKYACVFVLSMDDSEAGALDTAKQQLGDYIKFSRQALASKVLSDTNSLDSSVIYQPDYVLFYLVHILAHQIESPSTTDGGPSLETIGPFFRKFYIFLWSLLLGDGEVASIDTGKEEDLERIALICSILSVMKNAMDVVDASKSDNTHLLCEIGLFLIKTLLGDAFTSVKLMDNLPLPAQIYEKAEENSKVDRSYLPAFMEKVETLAELKSGLPLSVVVKQGKRKADSGSSKIVKVPLHKKSKVVDASQEERKEKNKRSGIEKTHPEAEAETEAEAEVEGPEPPIPVSPKRKRGSLNVNENGEMSSPEMRYEPVEEPKSSRKFKNLKVSVNEHEDVKQDMISSPELQSPDGTATKRVHIFIKRPRTPEPPVREPMMNEETVDIRKRSRKQGPEAVHDDGANDPSTVPMSSPRGTPRRSTKLLTPKPMVVEKEAVAPPNLVGNRIRVWWPMDKMYYNGTVQEYQPSKKSHKVLYDDGDVEVLKLGSERWEILKDAKESTGSPSTLLMPCDDNGLLSKERKGSRNTRDGSDHHQRSSSYSKRKKSFSKQDEMELDDQSHRSDNSGTIDRGCGTGDEEEALARAMKRRKIARKGEKSASKSDFKSDDNPHGESPSAFSKDSRDSADVPLKAWKTGRKKTH